MAVRALLFVTMLLLLGSPSAVYSFTPLYLLVTPANTRRSFSFPHLSQQRRQSPFWLLHPEQGGGVRKITARSLNHNASSEDDSTDPTNDSTTSSSALYSVATSSSSNDSREGVVRWNDLLTARVPLTCEEGDEECSMLQLESLEEFYQQQKAHDSITARDLATMGAFVVAVTVALAGLVSVSGPGGWKYYLAGGLCAAASHVIPVPIDVVKTRKQVDPALARQTFPQAFAYIWRNEGVGGLLSGLGPTAAGYLLEGAIKFGVYEVMKKVILRGLCRVAAWSSSLAFLNSKVLAYAISAAVSGVAASIMLCPMEALRIRLVANPGKESRGWLITGYKMLKNEGVVSMSKGMIPMFLKQVPYTVTKNVSFDFITKFSYSALLSTGTVIGPVLKFLVPCKFSSTLWMCV